MFKSSKDNFVQEVSDNLLQDATNAIKEFVENYGIEITDFSVVFLPEESKVILKGKVKTQEIYDSVGDITSNINGIKLVDNQLEIVQESQNEKCIHLVRNGETIEEIAKFYYGDQKLVEKIYAANKDISDSKKIYPGQKLYIPD